MEVKELDTFIRKFYQLWNDGHTAHLVIDTCAGKAWVGLRLQLNHIPGPPHQPYQKKTFSESHQRRRERRAAAPAAANHAEEASVPTNCEKVNIPEKESDKSVKEIDENVDNAVQSSEKKEVRAEKALAVEAIGNEHDEDTSNESILVDAVSVIQENDEIPSQHSGDDTMEEHNDNEKNEPIIATPCPDVIPVYSIAILENCPDEELNDDYGQSIRRFLSSEQHLM